MSTIGNIIKEKRNEKKLSQRKLAELCGMSYSHICRLEKGENIPSTDTIIKISKALDIPLSYWKDKTESRGALDEYFERLTKEEISVFMPLFKYVNEQYCNNEFILGLGYLTNDEYKDIRDLVIDVVKNRLKTYTEKNEKYIKQIKLEKSNETK